MILADTSAWVEHDRATGSAVDHRLTGLVASPRLLATTEPVVMEVIAGARDDRRERDLLDLLARATLLTLDPAADFHAAARLYRRCRAEGVTPRGMVDCLIAAVALRTGASLLAADADRERVAEVVGISIEDTAGG